VGVTRSRIAHRNRSPHGWWIASYLQRFEATDEDRRNLNRRCIAWENSILVRARERQEAWRKAMAHGRLTDRLQSPDVVRGRKGIWRFEGLTSLLPIYDRLEDGAELLWVEHSGRSVRSIRRLVKAKADLEAFLDEAE
jgi:Domain of unknown function (DUF4288)